MLSHNCKHNVLMSIERDIIIKRVFTASHTLFCAVAELSGNLSRGQILFASFISLSSPARGRSRVLILISISRLHDCTAPPGGHLSIKDEVRQTVTSLCSACWTVATTRLAFNHAWSSWSIATSITP